MSSQPLYSLRVPEVYQALETTPQGLTSAEAEARRPLYGENIIKEQPTAPPWKKLLAHTVHWLALLLWVAAILAFIVGEAVLGLVIVLLILLNSGLSFWREYRAEQAIVALRQLLPVYARLWRDGQEAKIPASEVVPGDVLVLAEGDHISADARVVEEYGLRVNNSTLTGEAVPSRKSSDASLRDGLSELERPNLVFAGTSVVSGTGRAVVYSTGMTTQFGRIAQLTQVVHEEPSPLQKELLRITRIITYIALALGAIIFLIGAFDIGLYPNKLAVFIFALGVLVAIVPEGLPATITLALAMAVQRLAQHGVLVKKLAVVEMMGTISMVCTDKSGTLTQNQMTVREIWVARQRLSVSGVGYEPKGEYFPKPSGMPFEADLTILLSAAMLCNNSRLNPPSIDQPQWTCLGDQTEAALRVAAQKGGIDGQQLQLLLPRVHELPFDARRKRMTTIHRDLRGETAFVKGAPREVLQLCTHILSHGEVGPLTEKLRAEILAANDEYARGALRVLALARRELPARTGAYTVEGVERELTFLGLMAMMDPPRPEVEQAVKTLRQADIRMVMITGDYGLTAESLARRVGLLSEAETLIMTGAELETLDDARLQALLDKEIIFARMAPEHKLRLVSAFQARGEVVVVTGDGVNDAPALRKADIGVSMGIIGTDVAKEAADIILTNDNFASIAEAIAEGRATFDNIRKFITYIFSSNVPEVAPFFATALWGIPLALSVKQILAIDLGTDLFPALALGTEKPEPDVMQRPPRRRLQPLLNRSLLIRAFLFLGIIEATLCFCGYYAVRVLLRPYESVLFLGLTIPGTAGLSSAELDLMSATVFHAGVVTSQVGNAFACRTDRNRGRALGWFSNRALLGGIAIEITIILALIYIPPLARMFDHLPLPPVYWVFLALYAPILYTLDWLRKAFVRWWERFTHSMKNDSAIHPDNGLGNDKAHAEADYQDQTTPSQEKGVQS